MIRNLTYRFSAAGLLLLLSAVVIFHLLILTGVIPFAIVWGGRLQNSSEMLVLEAASIAFNLLMLAVMAAHIDLLKLPLSRKVISV